MLMMRRHEKDFMLRRDAKYGDDIKKRAAEFSAALATSRIPPSAKDDISKKLTAYQSDFFAWMDTAQKSASAQKAMSDAYAAVEPLVAGVQFAVDAIRREAEASDSASRASTTLQMEIAILLVTLGVAALALLIGRSVAKPLRAMGRAMVTLAEGDFEVTLPGLGRRDEIGAMAQAVETFKLRAIERARSEAEEKESEARAAAAARKADMRKLADEFEAAVGGIVKMVSSASTELEAAAGTLAQTAQDTQQLSTSVAAASEQASANVQSVSVGFRRTCRLGQRDQSASSGVKYDRGRSREAGGEDRRAHHRIVSGRPAHRRCGQADYRDCRANQSARAQCHHRGGARR